MRPVEGGTDEELRLRVSCLPVRLRVDQDVVTFLQAFFAPPSEAETAPVNVADPGSPSGESSAKDEAGRKICTRNGPAYGNYHRRLLEDGAFLIVFLCFTYLIFHHLPCTVLH